MVASASMPQMPEPTEPTETAALRAGDPVFALHVGGKMEIASTVALAGPDDLSMAYTPGVARVCEAIAAEPRSSTTTPGSPTRSPW